MGTKTTNKDLVEELIKRNTNHQYDTIISEARAGEFHDYKNNKYTCGKVELVTQLSAFPELSDIREDVMKGVYDEKADEDDKQKMREDIYLNSSSPEEAEKLITLLGL